MSHEIVVHVYRADAVNAPKKRLDKYTVYTKSALTVQALLRLIYRQKDPTLAFRDYNCYAGICGCCQVKVNGKEALACNTTVQPGETVNLEPSEKGELIRDLVVNFHPPEE